MALTPSNAEVAVTGAVMVGETSATAPSAVDGATTGFTDLGLVGPDGITESHDATVDKLPAWQNGQTVRTVRSDSSVTFTCVLLETSAAVVELAYNTTIASGAYVYKAGEQAEHKSFIIDVIDGDELSRIYIADGEVVEFGDRVYVNNQIAGYEITIEAYQHATYGNAKVWSTRLGATTS